MVHTAEDFYRKQTLSWFGDARNIERGLVPGSRVVTIFASDAGGDAMTPKVMGGLSPLFPATRASGAETWEIVSTSSDDNPSGIGAGSVTLELLDDAFVRTVTTVDLDGVAPVSLGANNFRRGAVDVATGGSGSSPLVANVGTVTVQVSGGGDIRAFMRAGANCAHDGVYTVPAGKRTFPQFVISNVPKNRDVELNILATFGPTGIFLPISEGTVYNSSVQLIAPINGGLPVGSDVALVVKATNEDTPSTARLVLIEENV